MAKNNNPGRILKGTKTAPTLKGASGIWTVDEAMQAHRANTWPQPDLFQPISNSLRLSYTKTTSLVNNLARPGGNTKYTLSVWLKKTVISNTLGNPHIIRTGGLEGGIRFTATTDLLRIYQLNSTPTVIWQLITTQVFRDLSAWQHIFVAVDTTQATSTNRIQLYVNGVQVTSFSTSTYPTQGATGSIGGAYPHYIGQNTGGAEILDANLSEYYLIDGYQLQPTLFGKFDSNNTWVPIPYTGSYGTNGFYLPFTNATTSQTLGYDASLNGTTTYDADQDPYRGSVTLHLTGNGPAGGQNNTFVDSSSNNLAITRQGTPTQGSFSPFPKISSIPYNPAISGASMFTSTSLSSNNFLTTAATSTLEFGANNFTIELWWYPTSTTRQALYHGSYGTDWSVGIDFNGTGVQSIGIWASSNGTSWNLINSDAAGNGVGSLIVNQNAWNHVAYVRNGTTWQSYLNGVLDKSITGLSGTIVSRSGSSKAIGSWWATSSMSTATGYISSFRIINGAAVYTAAFTPTNRPFGTLTNNLLAFSEDFYGPGWAIYSNSVTVISGAAIAPDGTPSATLITNINQTGLHIYNTDTTAVGTGQQTCSIYAKAGTATQFTFNCYYGGDTELNLLFNLSTKTADAGGTITDVGNGWFRCSFVVPARVNAGNNNFYFRMWPSGRGTVDSKGLYFWGAQIEAGATLGNYTPTPANFRTAPSLLLNFTNAAVVDLAGAGNIVTVSGATITSAAKYGSGALAFNGSSDYFQSSWSLSPFLSPGANNWTLETWVNMTKSLSSAQVIVGYGYESGTTRSFVWYYNGDGTFRLAQSPDGTTNYDAGFGAPQGGFALNTWYHLAIVRNSGAMTMYVNGKAMPNTLSAYTISSISTGYFRIGVEASTYFGGSMDDLRYTKGVARYTSDFAPPARALPETGGKSFVTTNINAGVVKSFTTTGTTSWTAPIDVTSIEVLVVAGGGSGGGNQSGGQGGGGGGGGLIYNNQYSVTPGQTYTVTVGAGGAGGSAGGSGANGGNSVFGGLIAIGGGAGGNPTTGIGATGGSGGGGGSLNSTAGAGTAGQGFSGATVISNNTGFGAGGGGAGAVGTQGNNGGTTTNGAGGVGLQFGVSGAPTYYAGGGGGGYGGTGYDNGTSTTGGGGKGGFTGPSAAVSGTANTGGGGGGSNNAGANGAGGSGIVLIRYTTTAVGNTSDATTDNLVDSPTRYGHDTGTGGEVVGNYATFNLAYAQQATITLTNGNLTASNPSTWVRAMGTINVNAGKWYFESTPSSGNWHMTGVEQSIYSTTHIGGSATKGIALVYDPSNTRGDISYNGGNSVYKGGSIIFNPGDIIGVALDLDNNNVKFYKNNQLQYDLTNLLQAGAYYTFGVSLYSGGTISGNFGQRAWAFTPPAGYNALTTKNLPRPTNAAVIAPNQYFDTVVYAGNGTASPNALTISSLNFQPDLIWIKNRTSAVDNWIQDTVRGLGFALISNATSVDQVTGGGDVSSVTSTGFVISYANARTNASATNYVAWCWRAGGTAVSNTAGTITSQVSANTTSGFSIVTYTGTGVNGATIGHGLTTTAPSFIIIKSRSNGTNNWFVYHSSLYALNTGNFIYLNTTAIANTGGIFFYTAPTTSAFYVGGTGNSVNETGLTYVAYCWSEVPGFSKFGSWANTNANDGAFVYTGFKPAMILMKNTDNTENWYILDSKRPGFNMTAGSNTYTLSPNAATAEAGAASGATATIDFLSNGFKIRTTNPAAGEISFGTRTYIYAAFAEKPFGNANGTAR